MVTRALVLILAASSCGFAQESAPIETDRPDQTETATTVAPGSVQVEAGVTYEYDERPYMAGESVMSEAAMALPTALVRVGLVDGLELRVEAEARRLEYAHVSGLHQLGPGPDVAGFAAPSIGVKVEILEESGILPQLALIGDITLSLGDEAFRPTYAAPAFRFTMAHTLSDVFSLGYNIGGEWSGETAAGAGIYTLTVGARPADAIGLFIEVFGELPAGEPPAHSIDGGFTYLPMPNLQFDLAGGIGLSDAAADYFVGAGVSLRLPY